MNTETKPTAITKFSNVKELKTVIAGNYQKQIENFFGDQKKALRFLSGVVSAVQRNDKLLECTPVSVINSFMTMAQLELMPSDVSGEAYVIPYNNKKKDGNRWVSVKEAQFQLGYQGLVTLFYRAGARSVVSEIVYEKDDFEYVNGQVTHRPDVFADERGAAKGAYCIVELHSGAKVSKVMSAKDILTIAKKFSKSYASDHTPWKEDQDPQLWMWRKTVLKQLAKLVPKNERLVQAISEDNRDSIIEDRLAPAKVEAEALKMGNLTKLTHGENEDIGEEAESEAEAQNEYEAAESNTRHQPEQPGGLPSIEV